MEQQFDIFISHASASSISFVELIADWLERENGLKCWYAPRNLDNTGAGKEYPDELASAILNSRCMIVVLNNDALQSKWVMHEVQQADNQKKRIIPFVVEELSVKDTGLSLMLNSRHFITAYPHPEDKFPLLLKNIKQILGYDAPSILPKEPIGNKRSKSKVDFEYDNGIAFLELNQDKEAFMSFFRAVKKGNKDAAHKLVEIVFKNCKNPKFLDESIWEQIKEIADVGEGYAELLMHFKYYSMATQNEVAVEYLLSSIEKFDSPIAYLQLGICYGWGLGVPYSDVLAKKYYEIALDKGCASACRYLGQMYLYGESYIEKDLVKAEKYLRRGVDMGEEGCYNLLIRLYAILGTYEKALELAQHAIDGQIKGGYTVMGDYFYNCVKDNEKAEEWYEIAGNHEENKAWGALAVLSYAKGDIEKAIRYARKGYSVNDSLSCRMLGYICEEREDFERAWDYYQQAILRFGTGYDGLARLYIDKNYHPDNYDLSDLKRDLKLSVQLQNIESVKYLLKVLLAENGRNSAIFTYDNIKDMPEAYDILRVGANGGDGECLFIYGRLLLESEGEMYNPFRGIDYIESAAERGNRDAIIYAYNYYKREAPNKLSDLSVKIVNGKFYVEQETQQVIKYFLVHNEPTAAFVDWLYRSLRIFVWEDVPLFFECFKIFRKAINSTSEEIKEWVTEQVNTLLKEFKSDSSTTALMVPFFACLMGQKLSDETTNNQSALLSFLRNLLDIGNEELFVTKIPYFKNNINLIWPDYSNEKILNGDFSNESDLRIFYGLINESLPDSLEIYDLGESGASELNDYFGHVTYTHGFNATKTKLFFSAYTEILEAYRNLIKYGRAQNSNEYFEVLPSCVCCSMAATLNYCLNSLKMLILSRNAFGDRWTEIVANLGNLDYLFEIAETFDDQEVRSLLYGYYHLADARNELLLFNIQLEHGSCKYYAEIINTIIKELDNNNISHSFQTATEDTIPQETKEWRDAMMEFAATIKTYLTME